MDVESNTGAQVRSILRPTPSRVDLVPLDPQLPVDRLSLLPVEVLDDIYALAYDWPYYRPKGPPSRLFLPLHLKHVYRDVQVQSGRAFVKLVKALKVHTERGRMIRRLWLNIEYFGKGEAMPSKSKLLSFFARLPNLLDLSVLERHESAPLTLLLLSATFPHHFLPNLARLMLANAEDLVPSRPFDPHLFRHLASFPSLTSLAIRLEYNLREVQRLRTPSAVQLPSIPNITRFDLLAYVPQMPLVVPLINSFTALRAVSLRSIFEEASVSQALAGLPSHLKSISVSLWGRCEDPCDHVLSRFSSLEHLSLGRGTFTPDILTTLRTLPSLTSVRFDEDAFLDTAKLLSFVQGPQRFEQLNTLALDIVHGRRGPRIAANGGKLYPGARPPHYLSPMWIEPRFTPPGGIFHEDNVREVIEKARENGIEVKGSVLGALEMLDDMRREIRAAQAAYERDGEPAMDSLDEYSEEYSEED
ncbi:hypothetical protein JCM10213_001356 [Rhodosporidiobolus nylandii]